MDKKSNFSQIVITIGLILAGLYVGFILPDRKPKSADKVAEKQEQTTQETAKAPTVDIETVKKGFSDALIKFGDTSKKVIFLEISDPSCPYCQIAGGYNNELNNSAGDRFKMVEDGGTYVAPGKEMKKLVDSGDAAFAMIYRNGHGAGEVAMKALYCAFKEGKFWEAKALLFSSKGYSLINDTVKNDMTKTGLMADFLASAVNAKTMKSCLDSNEYKDQLNKDTSISTTLGVGGTPGFFVNETMYSGAYSFTDMKPVVDSALQK